MHDNRLNQRNLFFGRFSRSFRAGSFKIDGAGNADGQYQQGQNDFQQDAPSAPGRFVSTRIFNLVRLHALSFKKISSF
jgi:hypothetical protein